MPNVLTNTLNANWRNYSPGGKRKKVTTIPFMGEENTNLRAMGTKRIGTLPNKMFSFSYMQQANFANYDEQYRPYFNRYVKYSELTSQELSQLSPEQTAILKKREEDEKAKDSYQNVRQDVRQVRSSWNSALATSKELRNWGLAINGITR